MDITKWTHKELDLMKEYFSSISFKLNVDILDSKEHSFSSIITYKNISINSNTALKELKFPIKVGSLIYVLSFDYLV